jgi:hypothetical protein
MRWCYGHDLLDRFMGNNGEDGDLQKIFIEDMLFR